MMSFHASALLWVSFPRFQVYVGRNNRQNDALSRSAAETDMWLHARGVPGSHVIIKVPPGQSVAAKDSEFAANLAAFYSKVSRSKKISLIVYPSNGCWQCPCRCLHPRNSFPQQDTRDHMHCHRNHNSNHHHHHPKFVFVMTYLHSASAQSLSSPPPLPRTIIYHYYHHHHRFIIVCSEYVFIRQQHSKLTASFPITMLCLLRLRAFL